MTFAGIYQDRRFNYVLTRTDSWWRRLFRITPTYTIYLSARGLAWFKEHESGRATLVKDAGLQRQLSTWFVERASQ